MIEIKTYSKPKKTGGSGGSSSSTKYISGVISEAEHAGRADKAKRAEVADQANYAGTAASAQNAAYASEAGNLHADAEILQKYLSLEDTVDPQVVKGQVKFERFLQLLQGFSLGNTCGFDGSGNGIINSVASDGFNSASQQGFGIKPDDNGRYSLSITDLIVWGKAVFNELEIRKLSYAGGNVYLSGAGSKLVKVVPVAYNEETGGYITSTDEECDGWKCYILADDGTMATQNWWAVGDQARCQTFNIKPGAYNNASNKEYWRCVVAVSSESEFIVNAGGESLYGDKKFDWIILSKTNCLTGSDIPAEGDAIVLDGHQVQTGDEGSISRTNVLMLETTGADTPRIVGYRGITDFTHEGKDVFVISPSNVTISSSVFKFKAVDGQIITIINDRGAYDPSVGYYYYDRVSYDNAYWTLIYNGDKQPVKGITPTEEAVNGIVYWRKDLSGGIKGDKGEKGDNGEKGDGVVMAYKNATSRPEPPVTEDLSLLTDGWSRTPQKGGSYLKVDNISYGSFDNGASSSVDSTSKSWTDVTEGGNSWKKSPSGLSDNYGWAIMKVSFTTNVDNSDVKVTIKAYSEGNYDFIQVHALDTEITGSSSLRKTGVAYISGNGIETSYSYHVTTAGQHFFYVSYCKDSSGNSNGDYGLFRFDLSDNLVSMPSTVWMSQAVLKEGKAVLPWSTPVQITGDDAYRVVVSPSALIFDTDDNGRVTSFSGKTATIRVYQGDKDVSDQFSKYDRFPSNLYNCNGSLKDLNKHPFEIQVTEIDTQVVTDTAGNESTISKTNGFLEFILTNGSANVTAHVDVQVNVAKFTGQMVNTNKRFSLQHQQLSNAVNDKVGSSELKKFKAEITQTAREISLSVSEKSIARRNLLVGSAFLREDNNWSLSSDTRIEMNTGYQVTNCIRIIDDTTDGKTRYPGVFWDGSQGGKSVKITKGKKYVISCWYFSNDANGHLILEAIYTDKQMNAERKGAPKYLSASSLVPKPNQWQLFTTVIDTTDAKYDYIAFNFYEYCGINSGLIQAYICRPMVEEGDTYNGWTLSQNDYDIIGANLIDNSRTLDAGGNVFEAKGQKSLVGDAYELTYIGSDDYNSFYRIKGSTFKLDTDYTISFEVRGDAKYMGVYAYYPITNTKFTLYAEPQNGAMTEVTDGGKVNNYVALIQVKELSKQQRVWSHFRFKDRLPEQIYFQFPKNAEQTGVTSWSVTITRPKIEVGAVVTEYTERKSDLVDKASLKAAGIEITSDQVILYGNKVQVKNPKENPSEGYDEAAMFQNGKLNAQFINAGDVVAKGIKTQELEAQNLNVTGNSRLGIFEIHKAEIDERDEYTVNGDSIKYSGSYKFPDGKTEASGAGSFLTYKPMFVRQGAPDGYEYMRLGHQFTEWDDGNISGGSKNYFFVGAAARYVCSGDEYSCTRNVLPVALKYNSDIKPAAYVYSVLAKDSAAFAIYTKAVGTDGERLAIQTNGAIRSVEALNIETIYRSQQISSGVCAARCVNTAEITIRLPINPVVGQKFYVLQEDTGKVNITGDSNHQIIMFNKSIVTTCNSNTKGQISIFIWSGKYWFGSFLTGVL